MITIPPLWNHDSRGLPRNGSVLELFTGLRESGRETRESSNGPPSRQSSNASQSSVTSLLDYNTMNSQYFEVLYIGKIKVSHKKAPPSFIDDALDKFRLHEHERQQRAKQVSLPNPAPRCFVPLPEPFHHENGAALSLAHKDSLVKSSSGHCLLPVMPENATLDPAKEIVQPRSRSDNSLPRLNVDTVPESSNAIAQNTNDHLSNSSSGDSLEDIHRLRTCSGGSQSFSSMQPARIRASSMSSAVKPSRCASSSNLEPTKQMEHNRTMLFQISRLDMKLISPDRKSVLLNILFQDIFYCSQGIRNAEHFGFICRESNLDTYVGYIFKCQNDSVADELLTALKHAAQFANDAGNKKERTNNQCEQCPIVWLNKLTNDVEGLSAARKHQVVVKRLGTLPTEDRDVVQAKFQGAETTSVEEQNDLLLWLLRAQCETRQFTHVHDTAENRHEFLSQVLDRGSGAIFQKAKRSLSSSFDQLLKRKGKDDSELQHQISLPPIVDTASKELETTPSKHQFHYDSDSVSQSPLATPNKVRGWRPRSTTVSSTGGENIQRELREMRLRNFNKTDSQETLPESPLDLPPTPPHKTPIMSIFKKMGPQSRLSPTPTSIPEVVTPSPRRGSWRQAIFNQVATPSSLLLEHHSEHGLLLSVPTPKSKSQHVNRPKLTTAELRDLWKRAVKQQIMLIRMEKENKRLKARQEEITIKRLKLDYDEIHPCPKSAQLAWETLLKTSDDSSAFLDMDAFSLTRLVQEGVCRYRRGEVWNQLVRWKSYQRANHKSSPTRGLCCWEHSSYLVAPGIDVSKFPYLDVPYEELLRQLTSHQHAILIDLGRTFPSQPYFAGPLGPGQLALYNLLKAYSLLDEEVGYCQGLSFIAGVFLLHASEDQAYELLRHFMLDLGLRKQYQPDMAALQVQLYQMTRLLHDMHQDLYQHLEENEVGPSLYAAPWFLTLFASQFPLGFVVRVFDLLFLQGPSIIFRVALALLVDHKDMLLQCRNFEQLMDYTKTTLPSVGPSQLERVITEALGMDIGRQLAAYEVEYHVLQEEMSTGLSPPMSPPRPSSPPLELLEKVERLEKSNVIFHKQSYELHSQLQSARAATRVLEANLTANQAMATRLERQMCDLESDRVALVQLVHDLMKRLPRGEEVVIPPSLVRCFEDFKNSGTGAGNSLSMSMKPAAHGPSADPASEVKRSSRFMKSSQEDIPFKQLL